MMGAIRDRVVAWLTKDDPSPGSSASPPPEAKGFHFGADFIPLDGDGNTIDVQARHLLGDLGWYATSVLAHAAMRYRALKFAEAPLWVAEETDDGEEWLVDHPLAGLLQYPNADEEMADLLEALSISLDETGMGLFVKDTDRAGRPGRLVFFRGDEFTVAPTPERIYGEFRVSGSGVDTILPPERVVFVRNPHPTDRWRGLAPVDVLATQLRIERGLLRSMLHGLNNATVPGLTVTFPEGMNLTPEQHEDFRGKLMASYQSARNHGRPLVLGGGATAQQNTLGFAGLAGGEMYREIESAVCVAFNVRPEILGMMVGLENSPWSHMSTAQRLSYDEGIIPAWRRAERAFTRQLLRPMDGAPNRMVRFDTSKIRALQEDAELNARRSVLLRGIATRNQRRIIAGLEPEEGAWWDEVDGQTAPDLSSPDDAPPVVEARSQKSVAPGSTLQWAAFDLSTKAGANVWEPVVAQMLAKQSRDIVALFRRYVKESGGKPDESTLLQFLGEVGVYLGAAGATEARAILEPLVRSTATTAGRRLAAQVGLGFDVLQPGLTAYIEAETTFLVAKMGETTGRAVARVVQRGLEEGATVAEMRGRLIMLPEFDRKRAQLVARTENTRAWNGAQRRTAQEAEGQYGIAMEKTWISSRDERVRDEHDALDDGEWYPVGHVFDNGLPNPGEPNCRCTLGYRVKEDGQ